MIVIDTAHSWSHPRVITTGVLLASSSVLGIRVLDQINEALGYGMPDAIFLPLFLGIGLLWPVACLVRFYRSLFPFFNVVLFIGAYALGWSLAFFILQVAEFGPWKGHIPDERRMIHLLARWGVFFGEVVVVSGVVGCVSWAGCRLRHGQPIIQDGTLCGCCGYSLIGNESQQCPECGTRVPASEGPDHNSPNSSVSLWMKAALFGILVAFGWAVMAHRSTPQALAAAYRANWTDQGMWLPDKGEIQFFAENFSDTKPELLLALSDDNPDIRMRVAYVLERLGPRATECQSEVVSALLEEPEQLVRVYFLNMLRAVQQPDEMTISAVRARWQSGDQEERIYAASALFRLSDDAKDRQDTEAYVCSFFRPNAEGESGEVDIDQYWDLRWSAVNAVQHMTGSGQARPLLEAMLDEPNARPWVHTQVPAALARLRGGRDGG